MWADKPSPWAEKLTRHASAAELGGGTEERRHSDPAIAGMTRASAMPSEGLCDSTRRVSDPINSDVFLQVTALQPRPSSAGAPVVVVLF